MPSASDNQEHDTEPAFKGAYCVTGELANTWSYSLWCVNIHFLKDFTVGIGQNFVSYPYYIFIYR